jgi:hypothetical protein
LLKRILDESGQTILEFAMILPVFVTVGFLLADIVFMTKQVANVEYVATEVARCEALHEMNPPAALPCNPSTGGKIPKEYAKDLARDYRLGTGPELTITTPPCDAASGICTDTISYRYHPLGVYFPPFTFVRNGTASYVPPPPAP